MIVMENFTPGWKKLLLDSWVRGTWKERADGTVDVEGDVRIYMYNSNVMSIKFGKVSGNFVCENSDFLDSLRNFPEEVGDRISVDRCPRVTSLYGAPPAESFMFDESSMEERELEITRDSKMRNEWLKSKLTLDEFLHQRRGQLKGNKFGI